MRPPDVTLTIGAVADATGVSVDMLRSWEQRYGFPVPERQAGGHRRYHAGHVAQIGQIQADRRAGMSLEAAIGRTRQQVDQPETSIFAGLRRRWPDLPVQTLSKRALLAATRAIEDESCVHAERPILVGCFQRERYYRRSEQRWRELARTASWAVVFADFATTSERPDGATEVAVSGDDPLLREWAFICDSPRFAACVTAVEPAGRGPKQERRFEAIWSVDPIVVREATRIAIDLAGANGDGLLANNIPVVDVDAALRAAAVLLHRTVAYLDP